MNKRRNLGHRAQRTGLWAESKCTNLGHFDPYNSAIDAAYFEKYWDELHAESDELVLREEKTHPKFLMPINLANIKEQLKQVPPEFLEGLNGIILLSGSSKQLKVAKSRLYRFGTYWLNTIFITPYPRASMVMEGKKTPPPHIRGEYERAGATYSFEGGVWRRSFPESALKTFYLNDVLIHEIGHHVARYVRKKHQREENFADWFAMEYGHKWNREK